jgi:mRNA interferase RelE/StbE
LDYELKLYRDALKFVAKQDKPNRKRIMAALEGLQKEPPEGDIKRMQGEDGLFRLRIGSYRAIYEMDRETGTVYVLAIGNRGDIYKR